MLNDQVITGREFSFSNGLVAKSVMDLYTILVNYPQLFNEHLHNNNNIITNDLTIWLTNNNYGKFSEILNPLTEYSSFIMKFYELVVQESQLESQNSSLNNSNSNKANDDELIKSLNELNTASSSAISSTSVSSTSVSSTSVSSTSASSINTSSNNVNPIGVNSVNTNSPTVTPINNSNISNVQQQQIIANEVSNSDTSPQIINMSNNSVIINVLNLTLDSEQILEPLIRDFETELSDFNNL